MYKLIAFDLDGTLLYDIKRISEENYEALRVLHKKGIILVPTSGRSLYEIPKEVRECPCFEYAITSGGACTYDLKSGEMINSELLTKEESTNLLSLLFEYENVTMVHHNGYTYVDKTLDMDHYCKCRVTEGFKQFIPIFDEAIEDFESFCLGLDGVELTCTFLTSNEHTEEFKRRLSLLGNYTVTKSARDNFEVISGKCNKGVSVLALAKRLGIKDSETIAVGDSVNDLAMIRAAGLGVAMSNAMPELKEAADHIACHYRENIAKYISENFFS